MPAPDPNCKLNISSLLTLSHPSDCLICANDIMIIVLLQQIMGGWEGWGGGSLILRFGLGAGGGYHNFYFFCSVFVLLLIVLS